MIKVAVDMTPCVSGGANGGILPATIEMLRNMSKWDDFEFIIITNNENHGQLSFFEKMNMRRVCVDSAKMFMAARWDVPQTPVIGSGHIIRFSSEGNPRHFFPAGLCDPEQGFAWSLGHDSIFRVRLIPPVCSDVSVRLTFNVFGGSEGFKTIRLYVYGRLVSEGVFYASKDDQTAEFRIPKDSLSDSRVMALRFEYPDAQSPASAFGNNDTRVLSVQFKELSINYSYAFAPEAGEVPTDGPKRAIPKLIIKSAVKLILLLLPFGIVKLAYDRKEKIMGALRRPIKRLFKPVGRVRLLEKFRNEEDSRQPETADVSAASSDGLSQVYDGSTYDLSVLLGEPADVLYCPFTAVNFYDPGVLTVSVLNDILHAYHPYFLSPEEVTARREFYGRLNRIQPRIISISEYSRQTYIDTYNYPDSLITAVPLCVQGRFENYLQDDPSTVLNEIGLPESKFILYPANTWPHKNHDALMVAFRMYMGAHPERDITLVLTGCNVSGSDRYGDMAERMGIGDRVKILGYVSDAQLAALIKSCLYLIFPSLFEGFGIPVAEAMCLGTTVLCSKTASLPEVGGNCVFYFDPRDPEKIMKCMEYVDNHPKEVIRKKQMYKEQLKKFNVDTNVAAYRNIFLNTKGETVSG